jgi:hypothetical protein
MPLTYTIKTGTIGKMNAIDISANIVFALAIIGLYHTIKTIVSIWDNIFKKNSNSAKTKEKVNILPSTIPRKIYTVNEQACREYLESNRVKSVT